MERRFLPQPCSRISLENRVGTDPPNIVGFASVFYAPGDPGTEFTLWDFGEQDRCVERIMPSAFDDVLKRQVDCRGLFNHDPNFLLGRVGNGTVKLYKDSGGLRYSITPPDSPLAKGVIANIEREDVTGSSFSFTVAKSGQRWVEQGGLVVREILAVQDLYDIGPVTFPAYGATTTGLRSAVGADPRQEWEKWKEQETKLARARAAQTQAMARARCIGLAE